MNKTKDQLRQEVYDEFNITSVRYLTLLLALADDLKNDLDGRDLTAGESVVIGQKFLQTMAEVDEDWNQILDKLGKSMADIEAQNDDIEDDNNQK